MGGGGGVAYEEFGFWWGYATEVFRPLRAPDQRFSTSQPHPGQSTKITTLSQTVVALHLTQFRKKEVKTTCQFIKFA